MRDYTDAGFFVLRTPLLPFEEFLSLSDGLKTTGPDGDLQETLAASRVKIKKNLQRLVNRPEVRGALWLASPDFYDSLSTWLENPEGVKGRRIEHTLYRYIARLTGRATPFGLFAGCTTGSISDSTSLRLTGRSDYLRYSRLDMKYLYDMADAVSSNADLRKTLSFFPNSSLYCVAEQYHHAQGYYEGNARLYRLISTQKTRYLEIILDKAQTGATVESLIATLLSDDPEIQKDEAEAYVGQLIDSQVLVSAIVPPISGEDPLSEMIRLLETASARCQGSAGLVSSLVRASEYLQNLDKSGIAVDVKQYESFVNSISKAGVTFERQQLIQVAMIKPAASVCLDRGLLTDILRAVETLHSITPITESALLVEFKKAFEERYGAQEIPLVEALDDETGIGLGTDDSLEYVSEPLLAGIDLPGPDEKSTQTLSEAELVLFRIIEELICKGERTLVLNEDMIQALQVPSPLPLPDSISVMGNISAPAANGKRSFYLESVSGPSGANLMARFCPFDSLLKSKVEALLQIENEIGKSKKVELAEILHLPQGRLGNILYRPAFREYEIPYLANSLLCAQRQLPITDLMISVRQKKIVLRSRKLDREILPRLTTAHAYFHSSNLKIYRFLCTLQSQGVNTGLSWNWGALNKCLSFLPRVTTSNVVLACARWRLSKDACKELAEGQGSARIIRLREFRKKQNLPRFVMLVENDNRLLIDFDNPLSAEAFLDYLSNRDEAVIQEFWPGPEHLAAEGPEGRYVCEVIIPFLRRSAMARRVEPVLALEQSRERNSPSWQANQNTFMPRENRSFLPGSEWLYFKIYAAPFQVDKLLTDLIKPFTEEMQALSEIDRWFFIRYADPKSQLRLRLHGNAQKLAASVLPRLSSRLEAKRHKGLLWRVEIDTYEREVERYGGDAGICLSESLFHVDSELVLRLLHMATSEQLMQSRWYLAFFSVDNLLSALGFNLSGRMNVVSKLAEGYEQQFSIDRKYLKQVSAKFRDEREKLESILTEANPSEPIVALAQSICAEFSSKYSSIRNELIGLQTEGTLKNSIETLAESYVHMHINRMLRSAHNFQEMILYDFLKRIYSSAIARGTR